MIERYHTQTGHSPEIGGQFFMSGPQLAANIPAEIHALFKRAKGMQRVVLIWKNENDGDRERCEVITRMNPLP